jgi:hydrogenase expression/formation protein HypC
MCLAVPGRVVAVDRDGALLKGTVDFGGTRREVCLAYVPEVAVGDHVVVHVGFAIAIIEEAEAARTWEMLEAMTALDEDGGPP